MADEKPDALEQPGARIRQGLVPGSPTTSSACRDRASWPGGGDDASSEVDGVDPAFAGLVEEITRRVQAGEPVDAVQVETEHPIWGAEIRKLIPALRGLAQLGGAHGDGPDSSGKSVQDREGRRVFGDFHIDREIGRGGMGVVYEAEQVPLGRRVALMVLLAAASMDPKALQRFQLEAQVAGLLQHPRIVPVHAVGAIGNVPYFAMQLVEGGSLADLIAEIRGLVGPDSG